MGTDVQIHPTAIISKQVELAPGVVIGPYSIIEGSVKIGANTVIGPHVVIKGKTTIGADNHIYQFCSIGEEPQDKKYNGEETELSIGNGNVIRESVTINRGTHKGGGITRIGDHNLLMAYVHVAHDCQVGNHVVFSNNASLAGHVEIQDYVVLGGFVGIFQFCIIGQRAFLAGGSMVIKDVPPFVTVSGYPAKAFGLNMVGLKRAGFSREELEELRKAYKIIYRQGLKLDDAVQALKELNTPYESVLTFLNFIENRRLRGITR